ncbi:MAG TPA: ATPase, T2SS/T4P/T4SS family [Candidatus Ozemobacteraceae bacterium]|nr:ATPase, T2SS/T4P/T4SS family [Candidatus Ozemobacteraceae bacterium]
MDLKQLINTVFQQGGSELHLKVGSQPLMRKNKNLKQLQMPAVQNDDMIKIVKTMLLQDEAKKFVDQSSFEKNVIGELPCNYRLNLFRSQGQILGIVHIIRQAMPSFSEISFPQVFDSFTKARQGLFIIAGPARSGVSTSLAAFVERINQTRSSHILLIEDPIEFTFDPRLARISQRQLKKDLQTVEQGINFAKRSDVDVLVIGDVKREVPYKTILEYVNGGHFVVLSMQTLGIQNTLDKIIISQPESEREHICNMLARDLLGICSQALVFHAIEQKLMPIHETLIMNNTMKGIIQKARINQLEANIMSGGEGSFLFEHNLNRLVRENKIPKESADGFINFYRGSRA